jgi:hypothetical protein
VGVRMCRLARLSLHGMGAVSFADGNTWDDSCFLRSMSLFSRASRTRCDDEVDMCCLGSGSDRGCRYARCVASLLEG